MFADELTPQCRILLCVVVSRVARDAVMGRGGHRFIS
jgi:hypothetical protein